MRLSLGLVTYHIGDVELGHEDYMRLLGVYGQKEYPGFSDDPLAGFHGIRSDLERFCSDFLSGDGATFARLAAKLQRDPDQFKGLPA